MIHSTCAKYNQFFRLTNNSPITNFTIYGERHSGTKWLEKSISETFHLPITWQYDHKHFFGCCDWNILKSAKNTLFIGIVRNIYSWINGMIKIPYHLESNKVLTISPWRSIKPKKYICDSNWWDKTLYTDIFDMRCHKIEFLYCVMPLLVDNFVFIRYEDLILYYDDIISNIQRIYNIEQYNYHKFIDKTKLQLPPINSKLIRTINRRTFWQIENLVGYNIVPTIHKSNKLGYLTTQHTQCKIEK